ncbi:hypothetical protein C1646_752710 [Rhizophagus diaphanus]|nr:hypothetical protein C1646_752710 [Rhizophagus diaphanus] [Rhizophagus sp. MUCL 43196]
MEQIENSLANLTIKDCDKVTEFLEKCNFEIPVCLKQNAKILLDLVEKMSADEQILIIEWTKHTNHNSCNQGKDVLIKHITVHGGYNLYSSNTIFVFRNSSALADCIDSLPDWAGNDIKNITGDICHAYLIYKRANNYYSRTLNFHLNSQI